jgi:uncharacterized membrane protein
MLPLIAFFASLTLTLALLVAGATSLYLERERLFTVADGAALAAAESFALEDVTVEGGLVSAHLTTAESASKAREYLAALPAGAAGGRLHDLTLTRVDTDGARASVTLAASWRPPVAGLLLPDGVRLRVTSSARPLFG